MPIARPLCMLLLTNTPPATALWPTPSAGAGHKADREDPQDPGRNEPGDTADTRPSRELVWWVHEHALGSAPTPSELGRELPSCGSGG